MASTRSSGRYIFVVGAPRSGTTLLQRVLAVHDDIYSIQGESGIFSARNIFTRAHLDLSDEETRALLVASKDRIDFFDNCVEYIKSKERVLASWFLEKTPQHVNHIEYILKHFPNCKVVHIVRDGRDCFCSARKIDGFPRSRNPRTFAKYWNRCVSNGIKFRDQERVYTVKYEDLVSSAESEVRKIMGFLGMVFQEEQLDPKIVGLDRRSGLEHFSRLSDPISPFSVSRWKSELSEAEAAEFLNIAARELDVLGYTVERSRY